MDNNEKLNNLQKKNIKKHTNSNLSLLILPNNLIKIIY